jgi:hypothetical protein
LILCGALILEVKVMHSDNLILISALSVVLILTMGLAIKKPGRKKQILLHLMITAIYSSLFLYLLVHHSVGGSALLWWFYWLVITLLHIVVLIVQLIKWQYMRD